MAKNYGLLGMGDDLTDEDQQAAIRSGLLMGGLQMMMPVRGGRGKFAPQFAQGAMQGVGAYNEKLDMLKRERGAREMARQRQEAQQGLLSAFDYESPDEPMVNAMTGRQSGLLSTGGLGEPKRPGLLASPQNYGEFNPRGRVPNSGDMIADEEEQMAISGMPPEERNKFFDAQSEYRDVAEMPKQQGQIPPIVQDYPEITPDANGVYQMYDEVIGRRKQPTEPIQRQPLMPQQTTPGINPSAPMRVNNGGPDPRLIQLYKRAQAGIDAGVPGAQEALKFALEQLNPSNRKTVTVGRTVIDPSTGSVIYQSPDELKQIDLGGEIGFYNDSGAITGRTKKSPNAPTPTELSRLMQERDQLAQINPNHPQLSTYDLVITEYKQGGGVTVNTGNLGKPPTGFRWKDDGSGELEAIPGGPQDELLESQKTQLIGVKNTRAAIKEYRDILPTLSNWDLLSPDRRSDIGLKYNNMLLQAKEAYRLGVINGPDYEILQRIVTNPLSITGAMTSNDALDRQAQELDRIMATIESNTGTRRPQDERIPPEVRSPQSKGSTTSITINFGPKSGEYYQENGKWYKR